MKKLLLLLLAIPTLGSAQIFWQEQATTFTAASRGINQISYANANDIWTYAYDGVTPANVIREYARSSDGGLTWSSGVINLGSNLGIGCISAINSSTAFVAAYPTAAGQTGGIWKTTDSGATWGRQNTASYTGADAFTNIVYFWGDQVGMTMGDPNGGYFEIYTTTNGGTNWVRVPSSSIPLPQAGEYGYVRNLKVNGDKIWFGTNQGRLYSSSDKGLTWVVGQTPLTDFSGAAGGQYAFADSNNGLLTSAAYEQWHTTDGGATLAGWILDTPTGVLRDNSICYVPGTPNTYVALGEDPDLTLRGSSYSIDGGIDWIDINALGDSKNVNNPSDVNFFDVNNGWAAGFTTSSTVGGIFKYVGTQLADALSTSTLSNDNTFKASPNPTTGIVALNGKNITNVIVSDVLGKQISNTNYSSLNSLNLDMTSFNAGMYMVKVSNNEGNVSTLKVVKQ